MAYLRLKCNTEAYVGGWQRDDKIRSYPMDSEHIVEIPAGEYKFTVSTVSDLTRISANSSLKANSGMRHETMAGEVAGNLNKKLAERNKGEIYTFESPVTVNDDTMITIEASIDTVTLRFNSEPTYSLTQVDGNEELAQIVYKSTMERYSKGFKMMKGIGLLGVARLLRPYYREYFGLPINNFMLQSFNCLGIIGFIDIIKLKPLEKECKKWKKKQKRIKKEEKKANKK